MKRSGQLKRVPFPVPLNEDGSIRWSSLGRNTGFRARGFSPAGRPELVLVDGTLAPVHALPQQRRRRDTGPSAATRKLVLDRDGWACVCCGLSVDGQPYSLQHRKRRSQGGDNSPSNLITVLGTGTTGHHARIDSRVDPNDEAKGYTCRSWQNPAEVPVMIFSEYDSGMTVWLSDDGLYLYEPPSGASA